MLEEMNQYNQLDLLQYDFYYNGVRKVVVSDSLEGRGTPPVGTGTEYFQYSKHKALAAWKSSSPTSVKFARNLTKVGIPNKP